ncbi:MAG: FtsX-like permease family protein, partial [Puniceicoccales bacterium]|jgi:lipoprotein-releasing system permease protein|nr:FtsX-like permease family protein [Puniceicoccales bacterium]
MLKKILSQSGDTEVQSVPLPKELEVCAILETGFTPADEKAMYVTRRTAEELFGLPRDSAGAVHMKLKDSSQAAAFAERLDAELNFPMRAVPWSQFQKAFLDAVAMEKEMLFFLMFIILLVAAFSIGSTLFNHVVRRTREIGLLGALGGRPSQILRLFVAQGLLVGILGFAAGSGLAVLILHFRQQIVQLMRMQDTLVKQYLFTKVPLYYNIDDFIKTAVLTIILMIAASLLPALWAARRKPSEAMRHVG